MTFSMEMSLLLIIMIVSLFSQRKDFKFHKWKNLCKVSCTIIMCVLVSFKPNFKYPLFFTFYHLISLSESIEYKNKNRNNTIKYQLRLAITWIWGNGDNRYKGIAFRKT